MSRFSGQIVTALADNASATTSAFVWNGGRGAFMAKATWGGGTVKLQYLLPDGSTWVDVGPDVELTADGMGGFELPPGHIRVNIATATAVYAWIAGTGV